MGNLSGESREQNRKDKVTRFASVTYASQLGLLVNTLGSHLKQTLKFTPYCHSALASSSPNASHPNSALCTKKKWAILRTVYELIL